VLFRSPKIQLQSKDILITKDGTIGKVTYIDDLPGPATLNSGVFVVRPKNDSFDPRFLYYVLDSEIFGGFLRKLKAGSTISHLYQKDFIHFEFMVPDISVQQRISKSLNDIDQLILYTEKLIAKKRAIKTAVMQQLLTGKTRLPGFNENWISTELGQVCEIVNGGTPRTTNPDYWNGTIPWCTPSDITAQKGKYLLRTKRTITEEGLNNSSATLLPSGSLLLCTRATIGEVKVAVDSISTNQGFKSLVCHNEIDNEYLYYLLLTLKTKFIENAVGSTFLEISKKDLQEIRIKIPSIKEQNQIAHILSDIDEEITLLSEEYQKILKIKIGMMQELLTGRTRLI
jgi:type I restriction enzyme, S subunit